MLSTRNSQQTQQIQQKSQQERNAKLIVSKEPVTQLPIQTIQPIIKNLPIQSIKFVTPKPNPFPTLPIHMINEQLHGAQSQNSYQQQKLPAHMQAHMKTLYDIVNRSQMPVRRRRRKSRRQRKIRNNLEESSNFWPDRLVSKGSYPIKSTLKPINYKTGTFGDANDIAYAISLSGNNKSSFNPISNNSNRLNDLNVQTKNYKIWSPVKAENVLEAPFATSTSAGKTRMIIISSSRTITTSTDRTGNEGKQHNTIKHRKETIQQRPTDDPSRIESHLEASKRLDHEHNGPWKNKYNIDYDNKLEDEYEIIMKDE